MLEKAYKREREREREREGGGGELIIRQLFLSELKENFTFLIHVLSFVRYV